MIGPDLRLSTRTLLALTALVAAALGAGLWTSRMVRLSRLYLARASAHDDQARRALRAAGIEDEWVVYLKQDVEDALRRADEQGPDGSRRAWTERAELVTRASELDAGAAASRHREAAYHTWLAAKYREASRRPWRPVAPDAPAPR